MANAPADRLIRVKLARAEQLFSTLDPSAFRERDLARDAETFIVAWAEEFPRDAQLSIEISLQEPPQPPLTTELVIQSVRNYFTYLEGIARADVRRLLQQGRTSFLVGASFLSVCLIAAKLIAEISSGYTAHLITEGLTIGGWVAMWRPMEIHLYGWWPLARKRRLYERLSEAEVRVETPEL